MSLDEMLPDQPAGQPTMPLGGGLTVSVMIPTKNRVADLTPTVQTLFQQTVLPAELVIVDQSESENSKLKVESLHRALPDPQRIGLHLCYTYDPRIQGLATARNVAIEQNSHDILLFLDDDVGLERDFLEQLVNTYELYPNAAGVFGCSGVVTNYHAPPLAMRLWKRIFMRRPFRDNRELFYWKAVAVGAPGLNRVTRLGCGLMSFRATPIGKVRFDHNLRGVSDGEDVDFCVHLGPDTELLMNLALAWCTPPVRRAGP